MVSIIQVASLKIIRIKHPNKGKCENTMATLPNILEKKSP